MTESDLTYLCDTFSETTRVQLSDGKKPVLGPDVQELLFAGHIERMFLWLAFALEVNYSGFFDEVKRALGSDDLTQETSPA